MGNIACQKNCTINIRQRERVEDLKEYKMAGVKWYGEGVFHRETVSGKNLSAKYVTPCVKNAIIYNRLFAWKESFAIVTEDFTDCYVSNEFPQFVVDDNKVLPQYIYLYFTTKVAIKAVESFSVGSSAVSRNRFKEEYFLNISIPLPPLPIQQKIVDYWQEGQDKFQTIQNEAERFAEEKYNELLKHCRLNVMEPTPHKGAFGLSWLDIYRWDTFFYRKDFCDLEEQLESVSCDELGNILNFISRPWSSKDFPDGTFEYIEISSVNKERGITGTRTVNVKKAPSRATTLVKKGDVILSTTRPYLGAFAIVPVEYDNCVCTSGFGLADSLKTDKVDKKYLLYFLKSQVSLRQMERYMTGGLYPAIVQSELEKIKVPILKIKVQREIVENIRKAEHQTNKKLTDAIRRFKQVKHNIEEMIVGGKDIEGVI